MRDSEKREQYIIIGSSAAGISCINTLVQKKLDADITCITAEQKPPYNKCLLADYLSGEKPLDALITRSPDFFEQQGIRFMSGTRVTDIDPKNRVLIVTHKGSVSTLSYDKLLIATGTSPLVPPIEGLDGEGIYTFHTLNDTEKLLNAVHTTKISSAIVVGAGLSGLECADSLRQQGVAVRVIEAADHVLPHHVTKEAAACIERHMAKQDIKMSFGERVVQVQSGDLKNVLLSSGVKFGADLIVCAMGGRPNTALAKQADIETSVEFRGAIVTSDTMQTSDRYIWAAGDCALVHDKLTGEPTPSTCWPDAMQQGRVSALAMIGVPKPYGGVITQLTSAFFGVKFTVNGLLERELPACETIVRTSDDFYHQFLVEGPVLRGMIMIGNTGQSALFRRALLTGASVADLLNLTQS